MYGWVGEWERCARDAAMCCQSLCVCCSFMSKSFSLSVILCTCECGWNGEGEGGKGCLSRCVSFSSVCQSFSVFVSLSTCECGWIDHGPSLSYLVSGMGSQISQLMTVAEIWRDEVGTYAHFFEKMYEKIHKNVENFRIKMDENLRIYWANCYETYVFISWS